MKRGKRSYLGAMEKEVGQKQRAVTFIQGGKRCG